MSMRVAGFAFGGIAEQARDFRLTLDIGDLCEIEIAAICLALTGERVFKILMSFSSFKTGLFPLLMNFDC